MTQATLELGKPKSRCQRLADLFLARPNEWIDARVLEIGGRQAWRTRVSDLRRAPWNMTIENRERRERGYTISEYRYLI